MLSKERPVQPKADFKKWENLKKKKMNEVLTHSTMWMNPENIMLSERNKSQRPHII